jgi:hypothetical protein
LAPMPITSGSIPRPYGIFIDYGEGALAVPNSAGAKIEDIPLKRHPESFQLDPVKRKQDGGGDKGSLEDHSFI